MMMKTMFFGVALLFAGAAQSADLAANERLYQQPKSKVYAAAVAAFNRLQIPIAPGTGEDAGIVTGSSASRSLLVMKIVNVTAQVATTDAGTLVTYTRSKANGIDLTKRADTDPKPAAEFFTVLDSELSR